MAINMREALKTKVMETCGKNAGAVLAYLPDTSFDLAKVKAIMINEIVADTLENDFYSKAASPAYMETTLALFRVAGAEVRTIDDIVKLGVYITSAVKLPKHFERI